MPDTSRGASAQIQGVHEYIYLYELSPEKAWEMTYSCMVLEAATRVFLHEL